MATKPDHKAKLHFTKICVKVVTCLLICFTGALLTEEVTIYRDGWGIPHIYGTTDRAVAFGFGYAQAQDRPEALTRNFAEASGTLAQVAGDSAVTSDFHQRLWNHTSIAKRELVDLDLDVLRYVTAFAAGIQHYRASNEDNTKSDIVDVEAFHVLALARYLFWQSLLAQLDTEIKRMSDGDKDPFSTGTLWGLAPERSTDDAVTLVVDPDGSWSGSRRWYEAHLHGPGIHAWGFTYAGLPLPVFGHNRRAGWGWLPQGPDTGDIYRLTFKSESSSHYRWLGKTRIAVSDTFSIAVKGKPAQTRIGQRSHLGPIIHRSGNTGYAYRTPKAVKAGQISQLYGMIRSNDFQAFRESIRPNQLGPATFLFGDTGGTLFYIRSGAVPIRSESVDWDRPVTTDRGTNWLGLHVQEDLVQLIDPREGWIVDAGTPPDLVVPYSPLTPDRFSGYVYNAIPGTESSISARTRQLLGTSTRMTPGEVFNIVFDTLVIDSGFWLRALSIAISEQKPCLSPDEQTALDILVSWDGMALPDRFGPVMYQTWREACDQAGRSIDNRSITTRAGLSLETKRHLIKALRVATKQQKKRYGHLDVRWKEIHRSRRGEKSWGLPGLNSGNLKTVRRIRTKNQNVVAYGTHGQSAPTVMVFGSPSVTSFSAVPFGQSDQLNSPHSWDQAEVLFNQPRLKPTRFDTKPKDLIKKEVIRLPGNFLPKSD